VGLGEDQQELSHTLTGKFVQSFFSFFKIYKTRLVISSNEVQHYCINPIICGSVTETSFSVFYINDSNTLQEYIDILTHDIMTIIMVTIIIDFFLLKSYIGHYA